MKENIKSISYVLASVIAFILAMTILISWFMPINLFASGTSEFTVYETEESKEGWARSKNSPLVWNDAVNNDTGEMFTDDSYTTSDCGWTTSGTENYWYIWEGLLGFDIGNMTAGIDVVGGYVELYISNKENGSGWQAFYALYEGTPGEDFIWHNYDWDNAYDAGADRVSSVEDYDDIGTGAYHRFDILDSWLEYASTPDSNDYVWFYVCSTNHMLNMAPEWTDGGKQCKISWHAFNNTYKPRLVLEYVEGTSDRSWDIPGNAPINPAPTGDEVADNITWQTPRCSYADEGMYLTIEGDSGANISVLLVDDDGNTLDDFEDSIRTDGNYDYNPDMPDSWYGFVRVLEENNNLVSDWGYVMPAPDNDEQSNTLYAVSTEHPQYNYDFARYLTYENDAFVVHWKTNIGTGESDNHTLEIWGNSNNTTGLMFSSNFTALNDNYFNATANYSWGNHWRYMIFTPNIEGVGFNDYDNLIYNLDKNYSTNTAGYLHAVILDTGANSTLADSHSCYWYIPVVKDGLIFQMNSNQYRQSDDMTILLQVGSACKILDNLPSLKMEIINNTGGVVSTSYESYTDDLNEYQLVSPGATGDYELRFTFSGDSTWSYIHDIEFQVTKKGALTGGDIADSISIWLSNIGMDNPAGYWIVTLVGMILLFLFAYKSPLMRIILPLGLLGFMIIQSYLDVWVIVLLALGAGLTLFGLFRKKVHGSGGQG